MTRSRTSAMEPAMEKMGPTTILATWKGLGAPSMTSTLTGSRATPGRTSSGRGFRPLPVSRSLIASLNCLIHRAKGTWILASFAMAFDWYSGSFLAKDDACPAMKNPATPSIPRNMTAMMIAETGRGSRIRSPRVTNGERIKERRMESAKGTKNSCPKRRPAQMTKTPATVRILSVSLVQGTEITEFSCLARRKRNLLGKSRGGRSCARPRRDPEPFQQPWLHGRDSAQRSPLIKAQIRREKERRLLLVLFYLRHHSYLGA